MDNNSSQKTKIKQFPQFLDDTPPNHNPIIGSSQLDTLENVHDVLKLLEELPLNSESHKLYLEERETWGLVNIIECLLGALRFEVDWRPDGGEIAEEKNDEK